MVFNDGDFVKVDYSAWRIADNKLIYTTSKKMAQDNGIYDEEGRYVPQLIVLGRRHAIKGVEDAIKAMSVNEVKKFEIEPKDAFGERDQALVKVMPIADFRRREIDPYPGMQLDIDGTPAMVKSVNSGRVTVDANHPFAGERLLYEIKVLAKLDKDEDKIKAVAEMYALSPDSVTVDGDKVRVSFGEKIKKDSKYLINKNDFVTMTMSYMDKIAKITVEEDYVRSKEEEKKE